MDVDWEDYLAPLLGDVVTNEISQLGGNAREWSHQARKNIRRNVGDYLKEESQLFPHSDQLDSFSEELDHLRLRIDRVKAKADRLYQRLDKLTT
jgi:ubiquinone biosynthesis protein UbiJ